MGECCIGGLGARRWPWPHACRPSLSLPTKQGDISTDGKWCFIIFRVALSSGGGGWVNRRQAGGLLLCV